MKKISIIVLLAIVLSLWQPIPQKLYAKSEVTIKGAPNKMLVEQLEDYDYSFNNGIYYEKSNGEKQRFSSSASIESSDSSIVRVYSTYAGFTFSAKAPGTVTITITEGDVIGSFTIKVVKYGLFIEHTFPKTMQINKGSFKNMDDPYSVWACTKENGFQETALFIDDNTLTASNSKVSIAGESIKGKKAGKVNVTLKATDEDLKSECPDIYGKKFTFKVTVEEGPKADKTKVVAQAKKRYKYVFWNNLDVDVVVGAGIPIEYELWYSTKKESGYKKVASVKLNDPLTDYSKGDIYSFNTNSILKPNKKYYFKVRGRYQDDYHSRKWSAFSKPVAYWTAEKPLDDSKVTFNKSTHVASWKAVKGAKGYTYTIRAFEFVGYNIFGQRIYDSVEQTRVCKKNTVTVPAELSSTEVVDVKDIRPIMKHGKYYYVSGNEMSKTMSSYVTEEEYDRWVSH